MKTNQTQRVDCHTPMESIRILPRPMHLFRICLVTATLLFLPAVQKASAQGTAFTYQGRLSNTNSGPVNGSYDFAFTLYNAQTGPAQVGVSITNFATLVSNGLFNVTLDFGATPFNGTSLWLDISMRSNSTANAFAELTPRQVLTPAPFAIYATSSSNLNGTVPATQLTGTVSDSALSANIPRLNGSATFSGTISAGGFAGDGSSLTNLNASQLTSGTVPSARFSGLYSTAVTINNASDSFSGNSLYIGASRTGGWQNSIVKFENIGGASTTNYAPALRVVNDSGTNLDGALSVSANVQPGAAGLIAEFGNANVFVVTITNDGTIYANGFVGGGAIPWQVVSGTAVQAASNRGYLLTSSSQSTVTLPTSPSAGDIVQISGGGAGGWKVAQNSGQSILLDQYPSSSSIGTNWTLIASSPEYCSGLASSADGTKLLAATSASTPLYVSTNSGSSWASVGPLGYWTGVSCSADGTKMLAAPGGTEKGPLWVSSNSGSTWTFKPYTNFWAGVASSADGTKLVAAAAASASGAGGQIYTSSDSGNTWSPTSAPTTNWQAVASSADGTKLVAIVFEGLIYTSSDSGATWTPRASYGLWSSVASSSDGTKLVAVTGGQVNSGPIWVSTDSGASWTSKGNANNWTSVASSADGTRLIAGTYSGSIYISSDSGTTWTPQLQNVANSDQTWRVASSADGSKLAAGSQYTQIYISHPATQNATASGASGYLAGAQSTAIELQYIGGNLFKPLSHEGTVFAY